MGQHLQEMLALGQVPAHREHPWANLLGRASVDNSQVSQKAEAWQDNDTGS